MLRSGTFPDGMCRGIPRFLAALVCLCALLFTSVVLAHGQTRSVSATLETEPVPTSRDAADDPAVWIHPNNPSLSLIFGTDKRGGGLAVYDLAGNQLQYISAGVEPNNVDVRYNFPLNGAPVDIVAFSNEADDGIGVFKIDPATLTLQNIAATGSSLDPDLKVYGFCLYRSPISGKYYCFATSKKGIVKQFELFDNGNGLVDMLHVRTIDVGSQAEGCVTDDIYAKLYVAEENVALWEYGAEPSTGPARTMVAPVDHVILDDDIEGLTIYYTSAGAGYLIASSQGSSEFAVFERTGTHTHIMNFQIDAGNGIDRVSGTDGIDVVNVPLNPAFPLGVFLAQDTKNDHGNQNFKLVPWEVIANAASPPLTIDTSWDPRQVGAPVPTDPPAISSFAPASGFTGDEVVISGDFFIAVQEVAFNGTAAGSYLIDSAQQIRATVPAGATTGPISVTTAAGTATSSTNFTIVPPPPPDPPANLAATLTAPATIALTWTDQASNESGFEIERHAGDGNFTQIATVNANVQAFDDTGLAASTTYTYRVRAVNAVGASGYSNEASASTPAPPAPPAAPTQLAAVATGPSSIDLSWIDNAANEDGFRVERHAGDGNFAEIAALNADVSSYSDTGLQAATTYTYRIQAFNTGGASAYSNAASATTDQPPAGDPTVNLALNKPVTASSVNRRTRIEHGVDGNTSTYWESGRATNGVPEWFQVDLGQTSTVGRAVIRWKGKSYGKTYEIQVSGDAVSWTTALTENKTGKGTDDLLFGPVQARYVRVSMTQKRKSTYKIIEFELYSGPAVPKRLADSEQTVPVPAGFLLDQNYPNPFNPATTLRFTLPAAGHVVLQVQDVLGRQVAVLADEPLAAGTHAFVFQAQQLPSGIYLAILDAGGQRAVRRMLYVK